MASASRPSSASGSSACTNGCTPGTGTRGMAWDWRWPGASSSATAATCGRRAATRGRAPPSTSRCPRPEGRASLPMADVVMPRLAEEMHEGTVARWLKGDGDEVHRGDELVEIETDKANETYAAEADGVLEIVAGEGTTLSVGEVMARLGDGSGEDGATAGARDDAEDADHTDDGETEPDDGATADAPDAGD